MNNPTPAASGAAPALPEAIEVACVGGVSMEVFSADQMRDYALAALASREAQQSPAPLTDEQIDAMAIARYTVVPKPHTGFRYGVKVGDGESFCYEGHRSECETVAARMRVAFLDGAYVARNPAAALASPQVAPASRGDVLSDVRAWFAATGAVPKGGSWEAEIESMVASAYDIGRANAPAPATPIEDGYTKAFYEIASVLGIGARADTPENVFRNEMLPRIVALASLEASLAPMPSVEATLRAMARNYTRGHSWDNLDMEACLRGADEIKRLIAALASSQVSPHPDDIAVDRFAAAMKEKLAGARAKGRGGWERPDCTREALSAMLREHVEKGDPRDVANFCMFLHQRGEGIAAPVQVAPQGWKLVPVEPTAEMKDAAWDHTPLDMNEMTNGDFGQAYKNMLAAAPVAPQDDARDAAEDLWYLQDTRSYVGNDVVWWAKDGNGYTTDVSKAQAYTREKAFRQAAMRGCDRAWPKAYIDGKTRPAVDMQYIKHEDAMCASTPAAKPTEEH